MAVAVVAERVVAWVVAWVVAPSLQAVVPPVNLVYLLAQMAEALRAVQAVPL